jgi:hypothetical protein
MMQCLEEVQFDKQRLIDKRNRIKQDLANASSPNNRAWYRMKLENVKKEIREYDRSH